MKKKKREPSRVSWEIKINVRAWKDPEFKKLLLGNPQKALKEIGCPYADLANMQVVEEKNGAKIIVLHEKPKEAREMSEEELETLAGGGWTGWTEGRVC